MVIIADPVTQWAFIILVSVVMGTFLLIAVAFMRRWQQIRYSRYVHTLRREYRPLMAKLLSGQHNASGVEALRNLASADLELLFDPLFSTRKLSERQLVFLQTMCAELGLTALWQSRLTNGHAGGSQSSGQGAPERFSDRTAMRYLTHSLLTKEHRRLEATVKEAQRALTGIVDLEPLFDCVVDEIRKTLEPERGALFVLRSDQTRFRGVKSFGTFREEGVEVMADHPLIRCAERLHARGRVPILLDQLLENEEDRTTSREEKERLSALIESLHGLEGNLLIPLIESDQILGFVICSISAPPESWSGSWGLLPVIYPFFTAAAGTLRSMEIFQKQKEKERLATLGEMAAGLAHEIRNPLGAIKGAAQLLDPSSDRPESRFLKVIVEEVDRLNKVVTQFLDYSRKENLSLETIDLSQLLERTIELLMPALPAGFKIDFYPSVSSARVKADPVQVHQVFLNLIQNSVQALASRGGGGSAAPEARLEIRVIIDEGAAGDIRVIVEDNGPGIKKENLPKLFIPFFTTSPKGTGLGLSICQKIVESHSGRIEVASEEGKYAKFTVFFPNGGRAAVQPETEGGSA